MQYNVHSNLKKDKIAQCVTFHMALLDCSHFVHSLKKYECAHAPMLALVSPVPFDHAASHGVPYDNCDPSAAFERLTVMIACPLMVIIPSSAVRLSYCRAADRCCVRQNKARGHARRLPFLFLTRVSILSQFARGGAWDPERPRRPRPVISMPSHWDTHTSAWVVFVWWPRPAGARVSVGTAGRARHPFLGCSPASWLCARVAVGVGRGRPPEKPGPNARFLHGSHARCHHQNMSTQHPRFHVGVVIPVVNPALT